MLKVLIVDDSAVICTMVRRVMENDDRFEVVGVAHDGQASVTKNSVLNPDLIIMDIHMPVMDGIQATREILKTSNPAIVAFTTEDKAAVGFKCLEVGALEIIKKPVLAEMDEKYLQGFCDRLAVIADTHKLAKMTDTAPKPEQPPAQKSTLKGEYKALLIGSSTGGPTAVQTVLKGLGPDFPLPILVTQHIDDQFDTQFARWLKDTTGMDVEVAKSGVVPENGRVYIAPAGSHLTVTAEKDSFCLTLNQDPPVHFLRPAVDKMFSSAASVLGEQVVAVLLTGMGRDGAEGCYEIVQKGGFTIAEDESTCVVFGMPKAAIDKGAASIVLPLGIIAEYLKANICKK